jgi:hypothetical protein
VQREGRLAGELATRFVDRDVRRYGDDTILHRLRRAGRKLDLERLVCVAEQHAGSGNTDTARIFARRDGIFVLLAGSETASAR